MEVIIRFIPFASMGNLYTFYVTSKLRSQLLLDQEPSLEALQNSTKHDIILYRV